MKRYFLNYIIDIGLIITFIMSFATGVFKFPAITPYMTEIYRIFPVPIMNLVHDWAGLIMGILVLLHLVLHWGWIVAITKKIFKRNKNEESY